MNRAVRTNLSRWVAGLLPASWRVHLRKRLGLFEPTSPVIQEWEWYARNQKPPPGGGGYHPGDEWNDPEKIGVDVPAGEVVSYLSRALIEPYVGTSSTVLEVGCGAGRFTGVLAERAGRVIAADTAPTMLDILERRLSSAKNVEYLLLDGRSLRPVPDTSIDFVFSYDVFVHLTQWETFNYLREIARILRRPDGIAVIHHPNSLAELGWRKFERDADRRRDGLAAMGAFYWMTPELFRTLAERAGLRVELSHTELVRRDGVTVLASATGWM